MMTIWTFLKTNVILLTFCSILTQILFMIHASSSSQRDFFDKPKIKHQFQILIGYEQWKLMIKNLVVHNYREIQMNEHVRPS